MEAQNQQSVMIATGGTGGHIFPAIALAERLMAQGIRVHVVTDKRFVAHIKERIHTDVHVIPSSSLAGGVVRKIVALVKLLRGYLAARALIAKVQPIAVVGFGGYPSFPAMLAAVHRKIPTVIHEQNSVLGKANRYLADKVTAIATGLPDIEGISSVVRERAKWLGNPVRAEILALKSTPYRLPESNEKLHILVTGGSLGAQIFAEIVPTALSLYSEEQRKRFTIEQQCREQDVARVTERYKKLGIQAEVLPFFHDMHVRLGRAHFVIARAGASTLAEVAIAGKPSFLVPYPQATDNHQYKNTLTFQDARAAWVVEQKNFTPPSLKKVLDECLERPALLLEAAHKARALAKPDADSDLMNFILGLAAK